VLSAKQMGSSPHPFTRTHRSGIAAGKNLRGVGVNVNLAPVLGVYRAPGDFLDEFQCSFSMNAERVARLGANFIAGQQSTGVATTSKHFPGRGGATAQQNTDEGPVTLDRSLHTPRTVDEVPYPPAIAAGTSLVMPSWATYPALDPNRPAGLSQIVIREELRQRLGFKGVTITDALEAGSLEAFGTVPERGVLAAQAAPTCCCTRRGPWTRARPGSTPWWPRSGTGRSTERGSAPRWSGSWSFATARRPPARPVAGAESSGGCRTHP
jgi:beta-N-acetylhexosaminidase